MKLRSSLTRLALALVLLTAFASNAALLAAEERPVNFIFLVDVSGSMVLKSTMVKAADGSEITLFEALRNALKQMVSDPRLINPASRVAFITFGTQVSEKSDWPEKLQQEEHRKELIEKISNPATLSADKHGDTYMGGAVKMALDKAKSLYQESDPCTTTFILMMTDGWDEPPAGAPLKVRQVAQELLQQKKEVQKRVGVDIWQVRVIGLQRLPETKAGTTTAKELAVLLGGEFIDVNALSGGTVSDRIVGAVKKTVEGLKGEVTVGGTLAPTRHENLSNGLKSGFVDFGKVDGSGGASVQIPVELRSCYAEDIAGAQDCSPSVPPSTARKHVLRARNELNLPFAYQLISSLQPGAITVQLAQPSVVLSPRVPGRKYEAGEEPNNAIPLSVTAHSTCPAGHYLGFFKLLSTARVPESIPYLVSVPGRIVLSPESIRVRLKKPGFLWSEASSVEIATSFMQSPGMKHDAVMKIDVVPEALIFKPQTAEKAYANEKIAVTEINDGKPVSAVFDTRKSDRQEMKMTINIPAKQKPGRYEGKLRINISGDAEALAPSEIPIEVVVNPSAWEEVEPVAVPILIVLVLSVLAAGFLWLVTLQRQRH